MRPSAFEILSAHASSSRFTAISRGVQVELVTGQTVEVKLKDLERSLRPAGLRLSRYAFITEVEAGGHHGFGYGEAEYELIAIQKAIAEGFERVVFRALQGSEHKAPTTNGWAAHLNPALAHHAALDEVLERDAVLVHWLTRKPMDEVELSDAPVWLAHWIANELSRSASFRRLRVLVSSAGFLPSVTTVLFTDECERAVMSHATADTLERATYKALIETCRLAQVAGEQTHLESSRQLGEPACDDYRPRPEDHSLIYAHHEAFPSWIYGDRKGWKAVASAWRKRYQGFEPKTFAHEFYEVARGPLTVGYCKSDRIQNLFFGRTETAQRRGLINVRRLKEVAREVDVNLMPHCIP